jgi:hypothetical protein
MKEVQVSVDDKNMNLTYGGVDYRNNDGVITMPEHVAEKFLKADVPGLHRYNRTWGFSHISDEDWKRAFARKEDN